MYDNDSQLPYTSRGAKLFSMSIYLPAILSSAAAILFYLSAPGQTWLGAPLPRRPAWRMALAFAIAAVGLGAQALHPATALSLVVTVAMAWFIACPFLGAWVDLHRERLRLRQRRRRADVVQ